MTPHEINILIERYLDGETTLAEERELALAVQREDRPAEWAIIAEMLGELTVDEAVWTLPQQTLPLPLPKGRGVDTTSSERLMAGVVTSPRPLGRGKGRVRWVRWGSAAACAIVAFGLSYYIIKEAPQETAKTDQPQHFQPQQRSKPVGEPLLAACPKPPIPKPLQHTEHPKIEEPLPEAREKEPYPEARAEKPLLENQTEEPLPEPQPQLIAEEEALPPQEDFALCMALLAEVEARAVMLQQAQQIHQPPPQPLPEGGRGEVTTPVINLAEYEVSTPLPRREGPGGGSVGLLLDELLANIQQQSNRPELSL